jgi:histone-lysine N-methyltransferase SETMAR
LSSCPITLGRTASLLQEFSWEVFNHPPYSPDLAPSDFHVFLHLKKFHQRFENDREKEMIVTQWFQSRAAGFYDIGIQKLVPRYDKCLNSSGKYVEK